MPHALAAPRSFARSAAALRLHAGRGVRGWRTAIPIRWRILSIAILNTLAVLVLAFFVWDSARSLSAAWVELTDARKTDRLLAAIRSDTGRIQSLIHRYFTQPTADVLIEITWRRDDLLARLSDLSATESALMTDLRELTSATQAFVAGFDALTRQRSAVVRTYETEVLRPAHAMAGLYGIIDNATENSASPIWPALGKSREAFSAALVAANAFYLSQELKAAADIRDSLGTIERTIPYMLDLTDNDLQRRALEALQERARAFRAGFEKLAAGFSTQGDTLRTAIDGNERAMTAAVDRLARDVVAAEVAAQARFDGALRSVFERVAVAGIAFMAITVLIGIATTRNLTRRLGVLQGTMRAVVDGDLARRVDDLDAKDEIGDMARAVDVFRTDAIAKRRAEDDLRAAKERAEATLRELREAQASLVEAEKFAALGSLVAGVAHEVNNPVGISLTVASSLSRRCESFAAGLAEGQLRRSQLAEFVDGTRDAAGQLVANLQRAGELVQSFKQVAVDRTHAERRTFDLRETTEQIAASLRSGVKRRRLVLEVEVPEGLTFDSYPGPYGQVLTNLFLNAAAHAYGEGESGLIRIAARPLVDGQVEITFRDEGRGMPDEVLRRVFEPFFTTRRGEGGTGLGLHIVYNLVTRRLGGRITVRSQVGAGTEFRIVLPLVAPREEAGRDATELVRGLA